jgi:hypothetical protein
MVSGHMGVKGCSVAKCMFSLGWGGSVVQRYPIRRDDGWYSHSG